MAGFSPIGTHLTSAYCSGHWGHLLGGLWAPGQDSGWNHSEWFTADEGNGRWCLFWDWRMNVIQSLIHFLSSSCTPGIRDRKMKCKPCPQRRNLRETRKQTAPWVCVVHTCRGVNDEALRRMSCFSLLLKDAEEFPRCLRSQEIPDIGHSVYEGRVFGVTKETCVVGGDGRGEGWRSRRGQIVKSSGCCENRQITLGFTLWTNGH